MADSKELDKIDEKSKLTTDGDTAEIKFQHSTNGESKIEMPDAGAVGFQCGLTKEELMKYANDPFWIVLRRVLLVLFWLLWIAMLVGAVAIIIVTPGCAAPKEPEWYENSPVYELRVDKFYTESGELPLVGVQKKLPYLEGISVSTVVLDKVFNSENPRTLNPDVGAFDVFSNLTQKVKVIVKIPLSKTNLTNVAGQRQFVATLDLYLRNGAAGFVFDEIELVSNSVNITKLIPLWQELIGNYSTEDFPRVAMLSSYGNELKEDEICDNRTFILNYGLTKLQRDFTAEQFLQQLEPTVDKNRTLCRENLVFSNGDILPLINRVKPTERDRIIMFSLLADATPFVYFGEEYAHDNNRTGLTSTLQRQKNIEPEKVNWEIVDTFSKVKTNTFYEVFKRTSAIRKKNNVIQTGQTHLKLLNSTVVAMSRIKKGMPGYVVVTNFNTTAPMTVNLQELGSHMPDHGETELVSSGFDMRGKQNFRELKIGSEETMILNFVANFPKD